MIIRSGGTEVGIVTSGAPSPTLGQCIAMGFVNKDLTPLGTALQVDTGKGTLDAKVVAMPFYKAPKPA
jgi:aminomethyltransferase